MATVIFTLAAVAAAAGTAIFFYRRERRLLIKLQNMIDAAVGGSYECDVVDESMLSLLENSLHRFLKASQRSAESVEGQKKRIQTLISDISHQTITPISNIMLYTQLLEEKAADPELAYEIGAVKGETEKLSFLIDSLVKISRLETGIIAVQPQKNFIQELICTIVEQAGAKARIKGIAVTADYGTEQAVFDMKWTREALYNILDNAVKYTEPGGTVRISIEMYSMFARINITDSGIGIAEEEQSKIFSRFYRSSEVAGQEGVGIGLYLAREILSAEGGYIKVSSKLGTGSQFSVFLPQEEICQNCNILETTLK